MKPTPAQRKLIDAAVKREDLHVIGGSDRVRQALRDHGWAEVYAYHYGPLDRLTDRGREVSNMFQKVR